MLIEGPSKPTDMFDHHYECDVCGERAELERHNMFWYRVEISNGPMDVCSGDCLHIVADLDYKAYRLFEGRYDIE